MSEANFRQIRVLHLVSAGGVASALQPSLFMPLLTRLPRQRVKAQVACLSPGAVPSAVLRQNGVPTFDLALSRKRFSPKAFQELVQSTRNFRPDVIQAWGHTAQVISSLLRNRCDWKPRLVWSVAETAPLAKNPGFIDRQKLKYAAKFSSRADRIVYSSEAGASQHRRVGFPDGGHETVAPGVDATRFKPDFAARRKLREELSLSGEAFVVGMAAPFQTEYDHATLIRAVGELIKTNPNIALVLAGHGVQKGNAPLMALIGGGALSTRVHLLGEWSDINGLYNACDVVCSSAVNDQSRMNVVMAMLCGVPVVATGIGAQGELIGQHGVAIEPGSPAAFIKGINRILQLTPEKRTQMAQGARKHALANYVYVRSLQKYLQLYYDLIGRQSLVTKDLPTPEIDASLTVPPALPTEAEMNAGKRKPAKVVDLSDPDSLESKVSEREAEELPKWRLEQEQERAKREAEVEAKVSASKSVGDVLEVFESQQVKALSIETPMTERARGVADDSEELLSQDLLESDAPAPSPRASTGPSGSRKSSSASPSQAAGPPTDAAKQAALKAARMAALQPIAPAPKPAAKASPVTRPPASPAVTDSPAPVVAASETAPLPALPESDGELDLLPVEAVLPTASPLASAKVVEKIDVTSTQPLETLPDGTQAGLAALKVPTTADVTSATGKLKVDINSTQPLGALAEDLAKSALSGTDLADVSTPEPAARDVSKRDVSKTENGKADTAKLNVLTLDAGQSGAFKLDDFKPAAAKPDASKPDAAKLDASSPDVAKVDVSKSDAAKVDTAKLNVLKLDASHPDALKLGISKPEIAKADTAKLDVLKLDAAKPDAAKVDAAKLDVLKLDAAKPDAAKVDAAKLDVLKLDAAKPNASKPGLSKLDVSKPDTVKADKLDVLKLDAAKLDALRLYVSQRDAAKVDTAKLDALKRDAAKPDASRLDASKPEVAKVDTAKLDVSKFDPSKQDAFKLDVSKRDAAKVDTAKLDVSKFDVSNLDFNLDVFQPVDAKPAVSKSVDVKASAATPVDSKPVASKPAVSNTAVSKPAVSNSVVSKPVAAKPAATAPQAKPVAAAKSEPLDQPIATGSMTEFGELTLLATGEWQAMQRADFTKPETKPDAKSDTKAASATKSTAETKSTSEAKATAEKKATAEVKAESAKPAESNKSAESVESSKSVELSDSQTLSLISKPVAPADELSLLPEPAVEPKRAANGE